jgi:hypothetical protein
MLSNHVINGRAENISACPDQKIGDSVSIVQQVRCFSSRKTILSRLQAPDEILYHPIDLAGILAIDDDMTLALDKTKGLPFRTKLVKKLS